METAEIVFNEIKQTLYLWLENFAAKLPNIIATAVSITSFYFLSNAFKVELTIRYIFVMIR